MFVGNFDGFSWKDSMPTTFKYYVCVKVFNLKTNLTDYSIPSFQERSCRNFFFASESTLTLNEKIFDVRSQVEHVNTIHG